MGRLARDACLLSLLAAAALGAGCGSAHSVKTAQALRYCADRWNQDNMVDSGPSVARVTTTATAPIRSFLGLRKGERSPRCIVLDAIHYHGHVDRSGASVCTLFAHGVYDCGHYADDMLPLDKKNATIDVHGSLKLDISLVGTKPTPPLRWQRFPVVQSFVRPWTRAGRLLPGVVLLARGDHGRCERLAETVPTAISCLSSRTDSRFDACFPQRRHWGRGTIAACGFPGSLAYQRWKITARG